MLKIPAQTFRSRSRLAVGLSWVAGYTNAIALVAVGQTVSHQTGNTTHLGWQLTAHHWTESAYFAALVGAFGVGAVASGAITEVGRRAGRRSRFALPLTVEAMLLSAVALMLRHWDRPHHGPAMVAVSLTAALAMGLQNATITRISGAVVRTTHLTGVVTDLGLELATIGVAAVDGLRCGRRRWRGALRHAGVQRCLLLGAIFASFLAGAVGGTWVYGRAHWFALWVPVLFLAGLVVREQLADVAEVVPVPAPPDWAALVPASVGLFELAHRTAGRHYPPDFLAWAERAGGPWRVAVLSIDRTTRLHADAAINLLAAIDQLRAQGRTLIVAGLGHDALRLLRRCDRHHRVKWHDFPPDVEFALARAMALADGASLPIAGTAAR